MTVLKKYTKLMGYLKLSIPFNRTGIIIIIICIMYKQ